jgi:hypothetical protein
MRSCDEAESVRIPPPNCTQRSLIAGDPSLPRHFKSLYHGTLRRPAITAPFRYYLTPAPRRGIMPKGRSTDEEGLERALPLRI